MSATAKVLDRLQKVKQTAPDRWIACCPAHLDRSPSLSVREVEGRVLLHDFGGCDTETVLSALGLTLADLFDRPLEHSRAPSRSRIPAREVLELVSYEIDAAMLLLTEVIEGETLDEEQWQRLAEAARRIAHAKVYVHGK